MKKYVMPKADCHNPWMGLDGKICIAPKYWCRLHEVWLSEADVAKKQCLARPYYDMRSTYRCTSIDEGRVNPWVHNPHIPTNAEIEESINRWEDEMAAMAPDLFW